MLFEQYYMSNSKELKDIIQEAVSTSEMRIIHILASIKQDLDKVQEKVEGSITKSLSTIQGNLENVQSKGGKHKTRKMVKKLKLI